MANLDVLHMATYEGGELKKVEEARFDGQPHFVTAMVFAFEKLSLVISVNDYTDEVVLAVGDSKAPGEGLVVDVSTSPPWDKAIGREIRWAWRLTNQQGYDDGVQFEFANPNDSSECVIELIAEASMLTKYVLKRVTCESGPD